MGFGLCERKSAGHCADPTDTVVGCSILESKQIMRHSTSGRPRTLCMLALAVLVGALQLGVIAQTEEAPKRLRDYDLPGLDTRVSLESLDPWDVVQLIEYMAYRGGLNNIVIGKGVQGLTTKLKFDDRTVGDALEVILSVNELAYIVRDGILTIMTDAEYRAQYGRSFYDHKKVQIVKLKYASPAHVAELLTEIKSEIGTVVSDEVTGSLILIDTPDTLRAMRAIIDGADIETISRVLDTETETFSLQYAEVEDLQAEITQILSKEAGSVRVDRRTKTLIVTDLAHNMEEIVDLVDAFDQPQKQVFIEAKIVEVELSDEYRLGINWEHLFDGVDPRFSLQTKVLPTVAGASGGAFTPPAGAGTLNYKTIVAGGDLSILLAALKSVGETRILSNPHVAVLSEEEATIKVVRDEPYAEAQLESGTTNVVGERVEFIEVGVKLSVTPRINDDGFISMSVKPEVSTVVGQYQAFRSIPIVQRAFAETSVSIKDGQTLIIAGLIKNQKITSNSSVPLLGQIPFLKYLFSSEADQLKTTETVVFLTPRIITGDRTVLLTRDQQKTPKPLRTVGAPGEKAMRPVR